MPRERFWAFFSTGNYITIKYKSQDSDIYINLYKSTLYQLIYSILYSIYIYAILERVILCDLLLKLDARWLEF
jgi:hypothetical protein